MSTPHPSQQPSEIDFTQRVTSMIERSNPNLDRRAMAEMINKRKRDLAQEIHSQLEPGQRKLFPVEQLERRLGLISQEMQASAQVHVDAKKEGWLSKIWSGITYPIREPVKTLKFLGKAALVVAVVGTIGAIAAMYGGAWIERILQGVGLRRIEGAGDAAGPLGPLGGGENVVRDAANPSAVDAGGTVRGLSGSLGQRYDDRYGEGGIGGQNLSFENLWGRRSGPIVPTDATPGTSTLNALPARPPSAQVD